MLGKFTKADIESELSKRVGEPVSIANDREPVFVGRVSLDFTGVIGSAVIYREGNRCKAALVPFAPAALRELGVVA